MTEKEQRDEQILLPAAEGKTRLSTSRRRMMQAMALTTVGTAAASVYLPTTSAAPPPLPLPGQNSDGGAKQQSSGPKATFPTVAGTKYQSFAGVDFRSRNSATQTYDNGGSINANAADTWTAHLNLPQGAVIREVVFFYIDNDPGDITFFLTQYDPTTKTTTDLASATTAGASASVQSIVLSGAGIPATVDASTFAYELLAALPASANLVLVGARVGYTNAGILTILASPDRFVDTRINFGGVLGPLPDSTTRTFQITGRAGQNGVVIPDTATAIIGTLTAIGNAGSLPGSFLTIWPGGAQPPVSNVNYGPPPANVLATQFTSGLGPGAGGHGYVNIFNRSQADYLVDVVGYYS